MADEKVNVSPEESKTSEALAPSGPGDSPAPEHTEGSAVPGGDRPRSCGACRWGTYSADRFPRYG